MTTTFRDIHVGDLIRLNDSPDILWRVDMISGSYSITLRNTDRNDKRFARQLVSVTCYRTEPPKYWWNELDEIGYEKVVS